VSPSHRRANAGSSDRLFGGKVHHVSQEIPDPQLSIISPLEALRGVEGGKDASTIGEVREEPERMVLMHTRFGGAHMIDVLVGDPLPRIC